MKSTITISLDADLIAKLKKEDNYSDLINKEMEGYYNADKTENITILKQELAKTKQILKINNKKRRIIDGKLAKIREKEKKSINSLPERYDLIEQIRQDRKEERESFRGLPYSKTRTYFETPEEEADRIIRGLN